MKFKFHFNFIEYKNSKLATFLSVVKSGLSGFCAWMGLFLIPLIVACGVASQSGNAIVALFVVLGIAIVSYVFLFFIDESKIAKQESIKSEEDSKYTPSKIVPDSVIELPIEVYRKKLIDDALAYTEEIMTRLCLKDEYLSTVNEIVYCLENDLNIYEAMFGKIFYLNPPPRFKRIRDGMSSKALGISLHESILKEAFVGVRAGTIIDYAAKVILFETNLQSTNIFELSKEELKEFLITNIKTKIEQEGK